MKQKSNFVFLILLGLMLFIQNASLILAQSVIENKKISLTGCFSLGYCINIESDADAKAILTIDINNISGFQSGSEDIQKEITLKKGLNCIAWDGYDGKGLKMENQKLIEINITHGSTTIKHNTTFYLLCPPIAVDDLEQTEKNTVLEVLNSKLGLNDSYTEGPVFYAPSKNIDTKMKGKISIDSSGKYVYSPPSNFVGKDEFNYSICYKDFPQLCATAMVVVSVSGQGVNVPTLVDDYFRTKNDKILEGNILQNDLNTNDFQLKSTDITTQSGVNINVDANGNFSYIPNPEFTGIDTFKYILCNPKQAEMCMEATVYITVFLQKEIVVPNAFSPNGDGKNERLVIKNIEQYPDNEVSIFNRWGQRVYFGKYYNNDTEIWDAKSELKFLLGNTLDSNIYFYTIKLSNEFPIITGSLMLIK
jgi:gliding motility-associated-like protein